MHDRYVIFITTLAGLVCALLIATDLASTSSTSRLNRGTEVPDELNGVLGIALPSRLTTGTAGGASPGADSVSTVDLESTRVDQLLERMDELNLLRDSVAVDLPTAQAHRP